MLTRSCAAEGGASVLASSWTVYNELAATRPDLIHVLAKDDWPFDTYVPICFLFDFLHTFPFKVSHR
jgi:hypothetical protein